RVCAGLRHWMSQKPCGRGMAVIEHTSERGTDDRWIQCVCSGPKPDAVFDDVPEQRACSAIACRGLDLMPMVKAPERTLHLHVAEVAIPFELDDACLPGSAKGNCSENARRDRYLGTGAGESVYVFAF